MRNWLWICEEACAAQSAGMQTQIVVRAGNAPIAPEELNAKPTLQTITTFDAIDDALFKVPTALNVPAVEQVSIAQKLSLPASEQAAQKLTVPAVSAAAAAAEKSLSPRKRRVEAALPDEPKPKKWLLFTKYRYFSTHNALSRHFLVFSFRYWNFASAYSKISLSICWCNNLKSYESTASSFLRWAATF